VAYTLTVDHSDRSLATVQVFGSPPDLVSPIPPGEAWIRGGGFQAVANWASAAPGQQSFDIPFVILSTDEGEVRARIVDSTSAAIPTHTQQIAVTGGTNTVTTIRDTPIFARFNFALGRMDIDERTPNTLRQGYFYLIAPAGYSWGNPFREDNEGNRLVVANASGTLRFQGGRETMQNRTLGNDRTFARIMPDGYFAVGNPLRRDQRSGEENVLRIDTSNTNIGTIATPVWEGLGLQQTTNTNGRLSISGLLLLAQDSAPFNRDIVLRIVNGSGHRAGVVDGLFAFAPAGEIVGARVENQSIPIGQRRRSEYNYGNPY
jgi:hypothetical protein